MTTHNTPEGAVTDALRSDAVPSTHTPWTPPAGEDPAATYPLYPGRLCERWQLWSDGTIRVVDPLWDTAEVIPASKAPAGLLASAPAAFAKCDACSTRFDSDGYGRIDDAGAWCARCHTAASRQAALEAGIPASVVDGKTKLTDHFSQGYIDSQTGRRP